MKKEKKDKEAKKGFLKKLIKSKRILKKERATLVIKSPEHIPYKSNYFKEKEIQMENDFLFGK